MTTIADHLGLGDQIRELKLGRTFTSKDAINSFNTIRYDFKPASVDSSKAAVLEIQENNKVTVTAPNVVGSGTSETVYKGSRKGHQKECVLIIDHNTGEITLEKLSQNIIVKRTRNTSQANASKQSKGSALTPTTASDAKPDPKPDAKSDSKSEPKSDAKDAKPQKYVPFSVPPLKPNQSPAATTRHISPNKHKLSPKANGHHVSHHRSVGQPISPSMPTLSALSNMKASSTSTSLATKRDDTLGLSDSSSDSSDDNESSSGSSNGSSFGSSSDEESSQAKTKAKPKARHSDSESDNEMLESKLNNAILNETDGTSSALPSMPKFSQLSEDLRLSESGSDSE